jgi:hypothetical protein
MYCKQCIKISSKRSNMCLQISTFLQCSVHIDLSFKVEIHLQHVFKSENHGEKTARLEKLPTVQKRVRGQNLNFYFFYLFFGGLQCVDDSFAYVAHYLYLRDVCIRTQRAVVASTRATNLAIHLPKTFYPPFRSMTPQPAVIIKVLGTITT